MPTQTLPIIAGHHFGKRATTLVGASTVCSLDGPLTPWLPTWTPPNGRTVHHYVVTHLASGRLVLVPDGYAGNLDADMAAFEEHERVEHQKRQAEIEAERAKRAEAAAAMREIDQVVPSWIPLSVGFRPSDGTFSITTEDGDSSYDLSREDLIELGERLISIAKEPRRD